MPTVLIALSAALQTATAAAPSPAAQVAVNRSLQDVPGIKISYYDIKGKDGKAIQKALLKARGKDPKTGQPLSTAGYDWTVGADIVRRTTNGVCTVSSVKPTFEATALLPRLTNEASVSEDIRQNWQTFVGNMESELAQKLWFAHDRLPRFEAAVVGKPCDQAMAAGSAYLAQLKAEVTAFQPAVAKAAAPSN